ncbi:MAG: hypothetical protein ACRBN8_31965 [Nannocystales bacterium]
MLTSFLLLGCSEPERATRADGGDGQDSDDETDDIDVEVDEAEVTDELMAYRSNLVAYSGEPEHAETHADAASVAIWGTAEVEDLFHSIDAMDPSQSVTFSPGTTFVKEHFDEEGELFGVNIMFKGPEGYDPEFGDWVWLRVRGDEASHFGRVEFCQDCHAAAVNSDFVVGFGKSE